MFEIVPKNLPFAASQKVTVDASLNADGTLVAKVHYIMREKTSCCCASRFISPRAKNGRMLRN